jgi:hypothetical protein
MIKENIGLRLKLRTNIRPHLRWFEFLMSEKFMSDIKRRYETVANANRMRRVVQQVVEEEIYSNEAYSGSGNIKQSVTAVTDVAESGASVAVYFDPNIAATKGPVSSGNESDYNYAAFFDRPEFNSFILGSGLDVFSPIKYRPFREPMEDAIKIEAERSSVRSIIESIRSLRPRQPKGEAA